MKQKTLLIILIIAAFLLTAQTIALIYFLRQRPTPPPLLPEAGQTTIITPTSQPTPTPQRTLTPTPSPADKTAGWKTYTNQKYQYSFKYPPDYKFGPCVIKPCGPFVNEESGGDRVILTGDITTKGWPNITIAHYDSPFYNPPAGTNLLTWLKEKAPEKDYIPDSLNFNLAGIPAVKIHVPSSPQSYSQEVIYFLKEGKLLSLTMIDIDSPEAKDFYSLWLSTFKFGG